MMISQVETDPHNSGSGSGSGRLIVKIKRFLGTLLHFGCDISPEVGDRVQSLVFNLVVSKFNQLKIS